MVRELQVFRWVRSRNIHISRLPCTCSAHETRLRSAIVVRNITTGDHVQGGFNVAPPVDMDLRPVRRRETPITADLPPTDKQHLRMPWSARGALESWMFQSSLFSSDAGTLEWTLPYFLGSIFMITAKRNQRLAHTVYTIVVQSLLPLGVPYVLCLPERHRAPEVYITRSLFGLGRLTARQLACSGLAACPICTARAWQTASLVAIRVNL
jgi:hypothetical protein